LNVRVSVVPDAVTDDPEPVKAHWELEIDVACPGVTEPTDAVPASLSRLNEFC
jgi:hypothetical protein